jgi:hypothetical protein
LIEPALRETGACQWHGYDQIRIVLFIQQVGQCRSQGARARKFTAVFQSLNQYRRGKLVAEPRNETIKKRTLRDAAATKFAR